jgi:hypothetical protein
MPQHHPRRQLLPQPPQLAAKALLFVPSAQGKGKQSVSISAQVPSQQASPAAQSPSAAQPQTPLLEAPAPQLLPHVPQFSRVLSAVSQPSAARPLQFAAGPDAP